MTTTSTAHFDRQYQTHLQHLKLKGLQPKTIDAYSRAIRRIGTRFDHQIDHLTEPQLTNYFTDLLASHSWSAVKLDLYGLKFYYQHVLRQPWVAPGGFVLAKGCGSRLATLMPHADACTSATPRATGIASCRCRRRHSHSCAASGPCMATRC